MSGTRITLIVAVSLVGVLAVSGCSPGALPQPTVSTRTTSSQTATAQASVEPTTTAPINTSGPITSPKTGSAERTALLDAARATLGIKSQFFVYQLYVQGDTALGDIEPVTHGANGRLFVAWERRSGKWTAIGASRFGSTAATAANTARALPSFSAELIGKIDWKLVRPTGGASSSSMLRSLSLAAQKWTGTAMAGKGAPYTVTSVKAAQDASGMWWGHVVTQPTPDKNNSYEALVFWAKYTGGSWQGKVQDPEPPAPTTYFPASVIPKLGL